MFLLEEYIIKGFYSSQVFSQLFSTHHLFFNFSNGLVVLYHQNILKKKNQKRTVLYWFLVVVCDYTVDGMELSILYAKSISIRKSLHICSIVHTQSMGLSTTGDYS